MKSNILLVIGIVLVLSCEKSHEPNAEVPESPNYFPLTKGSYWVYDTYHIDSMRNETLYRQSDTFTVIGDTIIDEKLYQMVNGKTITFPDDIKTIQYYRDSANYIVNETGEIVFQDFDFTDTANVTPHVLLNDTYYWVKSLELHEGEINRLYTSFDSVLNFKLTVLKNDSVNTGFANMNCLYAPNVGNIIKQFGYLTQMEKGIGYYEARLIKYYIAN